MPTYLQFVDSTKDFRFCEHLSTIATNVKQSCGRLFESNHRLPARRGALNTPCIHLINIILRKQRKSSSKLCNLVN